MSLGLALAGAISSVAIGSFALGMEFAPRRMARMADRVPVVGDLATTKCYRCEGPAFRGRAEEMPVVYPAGESGDALTLRFCSTCSREMTVSDRLGFLYAEAEARGIDIEDDAMDYISHDD